MIRKYCNIIIFIIIAFCLLAPFALLKIKGDPYEIFPAALFPGGANKIHIGDKIQFDNMKLFGIGAKTRDTTELDKLTLFKYIHIHHIIEIESDEYFGALPYANKQPSNPNKRYTSFATDKDIEQTKEWFRKGLREQNCKDSILIVKSTEITLDGKTRTLLSETVTDERFLNLY